MVLGLAVLLRDLAFSAQRQGVRGRLDIELVGADSRQFGANNVMLLAFRQVDERENTGTRPSIGIE
jgi:hypothetical protein